jgi:predicted alpha/beta hydrolase family esterase
MKIRYVLFSSGWHTCEWYQRYGQRKPTPRPKETCKHQTHRLRVTEWFNPQYGKWIKRVEARCDDHAEWYPDPQRPELSL